MRVLCCSSLRFCFLGGRWILSQLRISLLTELVTQVASQGVTQHSRHGGSGWKYMWRAHTLCALRERCWGAPLLRDCWPSRHLVSADVSENRAHHSDGSSWPQLVLDAKTCGDAAHEEELLVQSWFMGSTAQLSCSHQLKQLCRFPAGSAGIQPTLAAPWGWPVLLAAPWNDHIGVAHIWLQWLRVLWESAGAVSLQCQWCTWLVSLKLQEKQKLSNNNH